MVGNLSLVRRIQVYAQLLIISSSIISHTLIHSKSVDKLSDHCIIRNKERKNKKLGEIFWAEELLGRHRSPTLWTGTNHEASRVQSYQRKVKRKGTQKDSKTLNTISLALILLISKMI